MPQICFTESNFITGTKSLLRAHQTVSQRKRVGSIFKTSSFWQVADATACIIEYLSAKEALGLKLVNKKMCSSICNNMNMFWRQKIRDDFCFEPSHIDQCSLSKLYVFLYLESKCNETLYLCANIPYYKSLTQFNAVVGNGVIGKLSDILWTDNAKLSYVLSRKRYMAMNTIVVNKTAVVPMLKKYLETFSQSNGPIPQAFLALDMLQLPRSSDLERFQSPPDGSAGFVGWVFNMVKVQPEYENLRIPLLWTVFRDMMIFETNVEKHDFFNKCWTRKEHIRNFPSSGNAMDHAYHHWIAEESHANHVTRYDSVAPASLWITALDEFPFELSHVEAVTNRTTDSMPSISSIIPDNMEQVQLAAALLGYLPGSLQRSATKTVTMVSTYIASITAATSTDGVSLLTQFSLPPPPRGCLRAGSPRVSQSPVMRLSVMEHKLQLAACYAKHHEYLTKSISTLKHNDHCQ